MIIELTIALGVTVGFGLGALAACPTDKQDDLPALGESIDRAIALAASLPPEEEPETHVAEHTPAAIMRRRIDAASPHR